MKLHFYGAAGFVSGSCYLLEMEKHNILVDCGMFQGPKLLKERNYGNFPFDVSKIDAVILTHAHIDHSGLLPKLYKAGYRKPIYATEATVDLCSIMLPDSGHIQEMEIERKNRKAMREGKKLIEPIYTYEDAINTISVFKKCKYNTPLKILDDVTVNFKDAGHIMGSAIIELEVFDKELQKIVFSGDLGRTDQNIIKNPEYVLNADYLLIESTYGNRLHEDRTNRKSQLADIILKTFKKGGNIIIPAFAVERTQDLLYDLNSLIMEGVIKKGAIYIDSPLAIAATEVFSKHPEAFDQETQKFYNEKGFLPFLPENLKYSRTAEDSKRLNEIRSGVIIISANGMGEAGRIRHHLRHNLWRAESSVIFVGYQAQGTMGRRLVDGEKSVRIFGEEINVRADIFYIDSYSAHTDYKDSLSWLKHFEVPPKKLFLVHGEENATENFSKLIAEDLGWQSIIPTVFDYYDFSLGDMVRSKEHVKIETIKAKNTLDAFEDITNSLDIIHKVLNKLVKRKFSREQFRTVDLQLSNINRLVNSLKKHN